jgi:hypothetical protein
MFLSPAQRTFRDKLMWRVISALPFVIMLGISIYDLQDTHQWSEWLWGFTLFFGALFGFACYWSVRHIVTVHSEGIQSQSLFRSVSMRWDEVTETRYGQTPVNLAVHFGLIGLLVAALSKNSGGSVQRIFQVIGPQKVRVSSNLIDVEELIRMVLAQVNPRMKTDAERLISSGTAVPFGPISLSSAGVSWKQKEPIPYGSLVKCAIEGSNLKIKSEGKWLNDISINAQKVPNVFVLIDLIEARRSLSNSQALTAAVGGASVSKYL